jgi:uncharacterized protein (DUF433 family)
VLLLSRPCSQNPFCAPETGSPVQFQVNILAGKPVIKGTRLSVVFLPDLLGAGWTEQQVLENYPSLKPEHLQA